MISDVQRPKAGIFHLNITYNNVLLNLLESGELLNDTEREREREREQKINKYITKLDFIFFINLFIKCSGYINKINQESLKIKIKI